MAKNISNFKVNILKILRVVAQIMSGKQDPNPTPLGCAVPLISVLIVYNYRGCMSIAESHDS